MTSYADLEISLHVAGAGEYTVEFRYNQPGSAAEMRLLQDQVIRVRFDLNALQAAQTDAAQYGSLLQSALFAEEATRQALQEAAQNANALNVPLRLRLYIGAGAAGLHGLHWEALRDPRPGQNGALCMAGDIYFSRFLNSLDWRPVTLCSINTLSALLVAASPSDLADYNLAPFDVTVELERVRAALGKIPATLLPEPGSQQRVTLTCLADRLRESRADILYLACHGQMVAGEPYLFLEGEDGRTAQTPGQALVDCLKALERPLHLVVLASCQSAGDGAGDPMQALGPRLVEAGIPAVLAMQGNISLETLARFMPAFFKELPAEGVVDRAVAVARRAVSDRPDAWMPALFMRLENGRIWYVPGFGVEKGEFQRWPSLRQNIQRGRCTPILGHGLVDPLMGSLREIARVWAELYGYPMEPSERDSLPQVAQYLTVFQGPRYPYEELAGTVQEQILKRCAFELPPELLQGKASLDRLVQVVGAKRRQTEPDEPHRVLARLPLPIYLTTNLDNLLFDALKEAGKDPQVVVCPWNHELEGLPSVYEREPDYQPSPKRPLIYHLFGRLEYPESIVLTEDDYFDYLIGVTTNHDLIPTEVQRALTDTALLFMGFQVDDWSLRVLLRNILSSEGSSRRLPYAHIAAQIEPEEQHLLQPKAALNYFEKYFQNVQINLFWGSVEDFMQELQRNIPEAREEKAAA